MEPIRMVRKPKALDALGYENSTFYSKIAQGLMTAPVRMGVQSVAWPDYEIQAIIRARVAGKTEAEIRTLVADLHASRKAAA